MDNEKDLKIGVRALAAEARRSLEHPLPEELLDYQAGDLREAERERIQEHLALCPGCVRALLDLEAFPDVEPVRPEDRLTDAELSHEWQRFRQAVAPLPAAERPRVSHPVLALAAVLLLAVVGLSFWVLRLRGEVRDLSAPQAGILVADLVPRDEAVERAEGDGEVVRVPGWADRVVLILNLADPVTHPAYRVEIAQDGREVWRRAGIRRSADGTFALEVPRRLLPAGRYRIRLFGIEGGAELPVAEYRVRIEPV